MPRVKIYLSSSFSAFESGAGNLLPLRQRLKERGEALGADVVLAEQEPNVAAAAASGDHMRILEGCARLAGACDAFFGVLFERHGTRIELSGDAIGARAEASFFEAELLEACMTEKPAAVVTVRGAEPSAAMAGFLTLVRSALGDRVLEVDEPGIVAVFEDFVRAVMERRNRPAPWLLDPISVGRIRESTGGETKRPQLAFLAGAFREQGDGTPDLAIIRTTLDRVSAGVDDSGQSLGQIAKLSYLWLAMREFAKAPQALHEPPLRDLFQTALGAWNSSAAWYGLHGAHPMGCMATLNELSFARQRARNGPPPFGARASAYYSIGARLRARPAARRFFRQSVVLATRGINLTDRRAGYSMRASALARLAALGDRLLYFDALADYRKEMRLRAQFAASASEMGEAQTEYAYALGRQPWRRKEALELMREGVAMMRSSSDALQRYHFLMRAERKHAELLARDRQWDEAARIAEDAHRAATVAEAFDQARQLKHVIDSIAKRQLP